MDFDLLTKLVTCRYSMASSAAASSRCRSATFPRSQVSIPAAGAPSAPRPRGSPPPVLAPSLWSRASPEASRSASGPPLLFRRKLLNARDMPRDIAWCSCDLRMA